jgi:hypothetical protein
MLLSFDVMLLPFEKGMKKMKTRRQNSGVG